MTLSVDEQLLLLDKIKDNKKLYNEVIDKRIKDISLGIEDIELKEFAKEEFRLNVIGIQLRKALGISVDGEAMFCNECKKLYPSLRSGSVAHYSSCRGHKGKEAFE